MDLCLPEMSGIEATREIRRLEDNYSEFIHTNIVAVTNEGNKLIQNSLFDAYCKYF